MLPASGSKVVYSQYFGFIVIARVNAPRGATIFQGKTPRGVYCDILGRFLNIYILALCPPRGDTEKKKENTHTFHMRGDTIKQEKSNTPRTRTRTQ